MSERGYVESVALTDIYADGIADVELLGDNVRLICFSHAGLEPGTNAKAASLVSCKNKAAEKSSK